MILQTFDSRIETHCFKKLIFRMKLTVLVLLTALLQVSANSYSQSVTLHLKQASMQQVFKEVFKQTGFQFFYDYDLMAQAGLINIDVANAPLSDVLRSCFRDQPFTYELISNTIVVKSGTGEEKYAVSITADQNAHVVQGKVVNQDGQPVPGITVTVKGSKQVFVTDEKGEFTISNASENTVLIFTAVNVEKMETVVGDRTSMTLTLQIKRSILDDVQIIGYGSTSKRLNTGSMGTVTSAEIANQPVMNPLMAMEGRVAGVEMTVANGEPGAPIDIKIRGQNTAFSATSYPLFIVDGVVFPYNTTYDFAANNPLNSINPGDIESISILKDADATAVYGSRGANGVVLITTKKGKAGAATLSIDASTGFSQAARLVKGMLNTSQYLAMRNQAYENSGITPTEVNAPDLKLWSQTAYTDWQKEVIGNTGNYTNVQASISGGDERVRYLISGAYNYNKSIVWGDNFDKRASMHANIENNSLDKRFQMSTNITYSNENFRKSGDAFSADLIKTSPNLPHYDSTGGVYPGTDDVPVTNPYYSLYQYTTNNTDNILANTKLSYLILPNLKAGVSVGYTKQTQDGFQAYPSTAVNQIVNAGYRTNLANFLTNAVSTFVTEPQLDYNTHLGKGKLQAMLGGTWQSTNTDYSYITGYNFSSDALISNIGAASGTDNKSSGNSQYKYESVFLRGTYNWQDKYIVNGSFRRDGSSRFAEGYKFGNFWSAGAAWIFSNESFFKTGSSVLNFGKIRGSYGLTGNDQIGDYQYLSFYTPTSNVYNNISGIYASQINNNNYRWEQTYKGDIGLELGFFESRILFTVDYFNNKSENLLTAIPLPSQAGFASYTGNLPAIVQNKGWEFTLNTVNIKNRDFKWSTFFNLTLPKNILLSFPNLENSPYANTFEVGKSIRLVKENKYAGISKENGAPLFYTTNGTITDGSGSNAANPPLNYPGDYMYIGNLDPSSFGGLGNIFDYKSFELNVFFQFNYSHTTSSFVSAYGSPIGSMANTANVMINGAWTKPGQDAALPVLWPTRPSFPGQSYLDYAFSSSVNYVDNSYIRLKTLALTWSMPAKWTRSIKLSNVKIYAQAQNLLTFTNYTYIDPESTYNVPILKTVTFGLRANL